MSLPPTADLAVVGAGVFGLATAAFAALRGRRPVVLERDHVGAGSSGRSGAIVRAWYQNEVLARAAVRCREEFWKRLDDALELPAAGAPPVFRATGHLLIARAGEPDPFAAWGVGISRISAEDVRVSHPYLRPPAGSEVAWWEPEAGFVETGMALSRLAAAIGAHGGRVVEECPVVGLRATDGGTWEIETTRGRLSAGALVLAPGPWARELGRLAGLDLPVEAHKVQVALLNRQGGIADDLPVVVDLAADFYSRSVAGGVSHVGFCSHLDHQPLATMSDFDETIRPDLAHLLRERFAARVEGARPLLVHGHRAAAYEVTPDENFLLGRSPLPGLFLAAGGSGHGYKYAPLIGFELAALIDGGSAPFVTAPMFAFGRAFRAGRGMFGR